MEAVKILPLCINGEDIERLAPTFLTHASESVLSSWAVEIPVWAAFPARLSQLPSSFTVVSPGR